MSYSIHANPYILRYVSKDYADNAPEGDVRIDCSLGVNADLLGNCIFHRLHAFEQKQSPGLGIMRTLSFTRMANR